MKRKKLLLNFVLAFVISVNLAGCSSEMPTDLTLQLRTENASDTSSEDLDNKDISGKPADELFISSQMNYSVTLFKSAILESKNKNILISPLSAQLALAMTAGGANGETKNEMENLLADEIPLEQLNEYLYNYVKSLPSEDTGKLQIANSIWLRDDDNSLVVRDDFLRNNADYYDAQTYKLPFDEKALNSINNWVDKHTDGMIDKIIDDIDASTIMYLINALVFDAEWETPYKEDKISDGTFTSISGEQQNATMMTSSESQYLDDGKATGFIKDYANGNYRFVALLPNEGVDIYDYINGLTYEGILDTLNNAQTDSVMATMPKFSYSYELSLNNTLIKLGMTSAFDENAADFSNMAECSSGNIYIGDVLHKTFISVDEKGTKAGAVSKVEMAKNSMLEPGFIVNLDRPFVYMVVDGETNLPIFIGALMNI